MTLRQYVYQLITGDDVLNGLGITTDSTFSTHTVDTPQVRPLCILRWQATSPGIQSGDNSPINQQVLQVWVHDELGSYVRIDRALRRVRTLLTSLVGVNVGEATEWLSAVKWEGDSDDLSDDTMRTTTKNAQFRFTGSAI